MGNGTVGLELNAKVRIHSQESGEARTSALAAGVGLDLVFIFMKEVTMDW